MCDTRKLLEPSEDKKASVMENDFSDLRVSDHSKDVDVILSRLRVSVRRQDSSKVEVYLGKFVIQ